MHWLSVVITLSLVGIVWFQSFERHIYALLNPEDSANEQFFAENEDIPSLFGDIRESFSDLRASIGGFISNKEPTPEPVETPEAGGAYLLPVEGERGQ